MANATSHPQADRILLQRGRQRIALLKARTDDLETLIARERTDMDSAQVTLTLSLSRTLRLTLSLSLSLTMP